MPEDLIGAEIEYGCLYVRRVVNSDRIRHIRTRCSARTARVLGHFPLQYDSCRTVEQYQYRTEPSSVLPGQAFGASAATLPVLCSR